MNKIITADDLFPTLEKTLCPLKDCNENCSNYKICAAPYKQADLTTQSKTPREQ
jgi:hypothetical protein